MGIVGRRRLWIIVWTVLVVATALMLLSLTQPKPPFTFLEERHRVDVAPTRILPNPDRFGFYSWKEDPKSVLARARLELTSAGYRRVFTPDHDEDPNSAWYMRDADAKNVVVQGNRRQESASEYAAPGWVTVIIDPVVSQSLWDRIKAVFGL